MTTKKKKNGPKGFSFVLNCFSIRMLSRHKQTSTKVDMGPTAAVTGKDGEGASWGMLR